MIPNKNSFVKIFLGAGEQNRTAVSSLARKYNSHYTTPALLNILPKAGFLTRFWILAKLADFC
jgi:hypothetical protein